MAITPGGLCKYPSRSKINRDNGAGQGMITFVTPRVLHNPPGITYTVQPNDTLFNIAQEAYAGRLSDGAQLIYNANKAQIGPDPNQIQVGMALFIPQLPGTE